MGSLKIGFLRRTLLGAVEKVLCDNPCPHFVHQLGCQHRHPQFFGAPIHEPPISPSQHLSNKSHCFCCLLSGFWDTLSRAIRAIFVCCGREASTSFHCCRHQRKEPQFIRFQGQVCSPRVVQPRLSICTEALFSGQYAGASEGVHGKGSCMDLC